VIRRANRASSGQRSGDRLAVIREPKAVIRDLRPKKSGFRYGAKKTQKSAKKPRSAQRGHRPA
jgi:hypothetical protein